MIGEAVTAAVGLVIGLLTGFFFERRATKAAERQNRRLLDDVAGLKALVRSLGGNPDVRPDRQRDADLPELVRGRAQATQNASGRILRQELVAYFVEQGRSAGEVESVISELCLAGAAKEEGRWLQIL